MSPHLVTLLRRIRRTEKLNDRVAGFIHPNESYFDSQDCLLSKTFRVTNVSVSSMIPAHLRKQMLEWIVKYLCNAHASGLVHFSTESQGINCSFSNTFGIPHF